jgi:ubiquinone/menaquinone biosynthesis C-methylase UbiE
MGAESKPQFSSEEDRMRQVYARRTLRFPADHYSYLHSWNVARFQEIERGVLRELKRHGNKPLQNQKILEVGCGEGAWLLKFLQWGAQPINVFGVDILEERLAKATKLMPPGVTLQSRSAARLAFADATFDIVCQFTMMTSILDPGVRRDVAGEMVRVLKPGGFILWYDFRVNNPRNRDVRAVRSSEIKALFPQHGLHLRTVTLLPPMARLMGRSCGLLYPLAATLKPLCTHYLGTIEAA